MSEQPKRRRRTKAEMEAARAAEAAGGAAPAKAKAPATENKLLETLRFVAGATKDVPGEPYSSHILLFNRWAVAFDRTIMIGAPIEEDIYACAHAESLLTALEKARGPVALTQLDSGRISVRTEKFRAVIECLDPTAFPVVPPDNGAFVVNDNLRTAFQAVAPISRDTAQSVVAASVLLKEHSVVATDRIILMEYAHGLSLPSVILPKAFLAAVGKIKKTMTWFGCSETSATIWFEDGSFIRSQLYSEGWPDNWEEAITFDESVKFSPLTDAFWEAFEAVEPFSDDGYVYPDTGGLYSHFAPNMGAEYECPGLETGPPLHADRMEIARKAGMNQMGASDRNTIFFFGPSVRGVLASRGDRRAIAAPAVPLPTSGWSTPSIDSGIPVPE